MKTKKRKSTSALTRAARIKRGKRRPKATALQMKAALAQIHAAQMQLASESNPVAARGLVGTIATLESRFVERFGER